TLVSAAGQQGALLMAAHRGRGEALAGVGSEALTGAGWAVARDGDMTVRLDLGASRPDGRDLSGLLAAALTAAQGAEPSAPSGPHGSPAPEPAREDV
nr:hypothetical protein [Pseudonocardiales bacterium]